MQMYCQSPDYVVCSNGSVYHPDRSSPSPAHQVPPHTPRSVSLLPQLSQICTTNFFVPNPPLSSTPSSGSGTVSSRGNSPYSPPMDRLVGDDYPYPYISLVEPPQFKPLFSSSGIETSTPPNEGSHYVFQHVQQQFYELYRPYKTAPSEPPLSQIPSQPYPPTFTSDYANSNQRADFTSYQTPCEQFPQYPSARSSVDYTTYADQNPDYIIGTSSMRYTASTPPEQGCVSPAMVSDGSPRYVDMSELSPSPPAYDIPQTDVCNPRAISGFEDPEQQTCPNLPLKRSPSATPPPMLAFADHQPLEDGEATPHVRQEAEFHSSGESEVDREEYEAEKNTQTVAPLEQPEPAAPLTVEHTPASPPPASTSTPTPAPASAPSQPTHETRAPLIITVPPPMKRRRGQAGPVPVPNLTKKSRGRSVPTTSNSISPYATHRARRSFICDVKDCGKCFARGEHLKRHVRSIHTNEKPFLCSFPGCDKAFSRHDNLGQHMRVHRHQR